MHCGFAGHKSYDCHKKLAAHKDNLNSLRRSHFEKVIEQIPTVKPLPRLARKNPIYPFLKK